MNENIYDFIFNSIAIIGFILGLTLLISVNDSVNQHFSIYDRLYSKEIIEKDDLLATGTFERKDVIVMLQNKLTCDIVVNGKRFRVGDIVNDCSAVAEGRYDVVKTINQKGEVVELVFNSR